MAWADATPWVERYAWFSLRLTGFDWIGSGAELVTADSPPALTALGRLYDGR